MLNLLPESWTPQGRFRKEFMERGDSLSKYLPYEEFIEKENIFLQKDSSLGVVYELDLLEHEPLTADEVVSYVKSLESWFTLPENCTLQVLFDQSRVSPLDSRFSSFSSQFLRSHPVSHSLFESRLNHINSACRTPNYWTPLERKAYVSIRYFPSFISNRGKPIKGDHKFLFKELATFTNELRKFQHIALGFEKSSKLSLRRLNAVSLLDLLRKFFNPHTYYKRPFAPFNPNFSIGDQIIFNHPILDHVGINREGIQTRTITLKTSPQFAYPGGMASFLKLPFPFRLSLNFRFPTKSKIQQTFALKSYLLENSISARSKLLQKDVDQVQKRLAEGDRCLQMTFSVILEAPSNEKLDENAREVLNVFHNDLHCEVIDEEHIGTALWFNSLPLNYLPPTDKSTQRSIRILKSDVTNFLPVFDSFRGLQKPLQLYLSREQNLVPFTLLENETSNHTVVLADSGSGKSAFVIDCVQASKRLDPEALVFVIDKGSSYNMLAKYYDANVTVFDRSGNVPFTPFRGIYDEDKIAVLTNLIISAVKLTSPAFNTDSDHVSAISKSLKLAYEKKLKQSGLTYVEGELVTQPSNEPVELSMDDFIAELGALSSQKDYEKFEEVTQTLAQKLKPFYGDGQYATFFRQSTAPLSTSKFFYIYDLDALDKDSTLQTLMTMAVFEEIRQIINRPEYREREKFIVLEEFAMVGRNNVAAKEFIIDFAERLRKLGCWLIALTPRPQNYFELEVGQALWGVADNFIFLQMSEDNVKYLKERSDLIDQASFQIIKSLRTKRGQFADVFYMNKKKTTQGAFRFIQTPLDRWLAPTNAKDSAEASRALQNFPNDRWKALRFLSETYPHGTQDQQNPILTLVPEDKE